MNLHKTGMPLLNAMQVLGMHTWWIIETYMVSVWEVTCLELAHMVAAVGLNLFSARAQIRLYFFENDSRCVQVSIP